jgi:phosphoglycerate dehydrogenase-like enzyme
MANIRSKSALFYSYSPVDGEVYNKAARDRITSMIDLYPSVIDTNNFDDHIIHLKDVEVIFATWGMICFEKKHFAAMLKLKAVFYAAGNVRSFAQPLIDNKIILTSAWQANAIPTAEMCLSQILLSLRGYFRSVRQYSEIQTVAAKAFPRSGINGETIGILGMGKIGSRLCYLLKDYPLKIIAFDPFLTEQRTAELGIKKVTLEKVFELSAVVCNHIPDLPSTHGILTGSLFRSMRDNSTFINTGRGAQVASAELARVLTARKDITALLDVTNPEPPTQSSEFWNLSNVILSPHIGGTIGDEVTRLSDSAISEFERWLSGKPIQHQITSKILETMG